MREKLKSLACSPGAITIVAFLVRAVIFYQVDHALQAHALRDLPRGAEMGNVAAAIAEGRGFSAPLRWSDTGPTAWFTPVYPYLLAAIYKVCGVYSYQSDLISHTLDISFASLTCWPIHAMGSKAFGKSTGVLAAWAWAFFPASILIPIVWTWDTAFATLWLALLITATLHLRGSGRLASWIGYGAMWAAGGMINPSLLSVLPFLALWAIWPMRAQLPRAALLSAASAAIFIAGIAPWTIRNYVVFHKFIPLRSNFGLELWLGNNPAVPDTWSPFLHPNDNAEEGKRFAQMTEIPYMAEKQREALRFVGEHPSDALRFVFRRFEDNWLGMSDAPADVWAHASIKGKLLIVENCLFSLLSLLGVLLAYRTQREEAAPFAMILLVFPLLFYISHTSERYRLPMDTAMMVLAAYATVHAFSWAGKRLGAFTQSSERATSPAH